MLFKSTRQ